MKATARLFVIALFAAGALTLAGCCCHHSRIVNNEPDSVRHFSADPTPTGWAGQHQG